VIEGNPSVPGATPGPDCQTLPVRLLVAANWLCEILGEFSVWGGALVLSLRQMSIGLAMTAAAAFVAAMGTDAGADGGFAVPPEFRTEIARKLASPLSLASYCNVIETSSNSLSIPTDETTPWQTTGGIQAYWENEAAPIPPTKPLLSQATLRLNKLSCLVPVSDELIEDATALASYLEGKAADKLIAKLNTAIIAGTGAGQPQGILKSTSLITVTKETTPTTQANGTVILPNIVNVWTRVLGSWRTNAVWLVNDDVIPGGEKLSGATRPGERSGCFA